MQNDKLRLVTGRARSAAGKVSHFTRLGLVAVTLAVWIEGSAVSARAQSSEALIQDLIRSTNEMADTLATVRDAASAQAAQPRLQSQARHIQDVASRLASGGRGTSQAESRHLQSRYGGQLVAVFDRTVRELERIDREVDFPMQFNLDSMRRQRDAFRAAMGRAPGGSGDDESFFAILLPTLLVVIFIACVACLYTEGMWSNAIGLINVVTAGLLTTNFFEPVADWLESIMPTYTYMCDFLAMWGVFALSMIVLRVATDMLSRVKVRFMKLADQIGSVLLACWIGWVMVCFATMTLHTAPLAKHFMFGGFVPEERMFMGLAPDRQWLGFTQKVSRGAFSRSGDNEEHVFDPDAEFMFKYYSRRIDVENNVRATGKVRVNVNVRDK